PVEKMNYFESDLSGEKQLEPLPDFNSMSRKELRELNARLRQVRPKRRKGYKQEINDRLRLQLEHELKSRGFDGSENEIDLLLRGGSIPSGAGLRLFYRNQRLQEDDKWRQWY
ncbi:TPA: replication endonuclease, partial [Klebsiella pneumoniae]|nr:replication endonuclease [Klebsiella pneumoniae]